MRIVMSMPVALALFGANLLRRRVNMACLEYNRRALRKIRPAEKRVYEVMPPMSAIACSS